MVKVTDCGSVEYGFKSHYSPFWISDRVAEGDSLEICSTVKGTVGSNPTLSYNFINRF